MLGYLPDEVIDLVYIDPPFATGLFRKSPKGDEGPGGYEDSWDSVEEFVDWIEPRLRELWRVLKKNGNLVIHLDSRAIHHLRIWCDREFGVDRFENEIIWHYTGGGRSRKRFSRKHDVLLWYSKGPKRTFNIDAIREPYEPTSGYAKGGIVSKKGRKYMPHPDGKPADDVWNIPIINPLSSERTGYPTQKPLKLIRRVVNALSNKGDVVCDVFAGSGTTAAACSMDDRRYLCCDSNPDAIGVMLDRLEEVRCEDSNPVVLSNGLYRIGSVTENSTTELITMLETAGVKIDPDGIIRFPSPIWSRTKDPVFPLRTGDRVFRVRLN